MKFIQNPAIYGLILRIFNTSASLSQAYPHTGLIDAGR
jgi:hypothetical protein